MAKRFITTDLFSEDWFLELSTETKLFWIYAFLNCDHAGVLRANIRPFNALNGLSVELDTVLDEINHQKQRIQKLTDRTLFIVGFVQFQYGRELNPQNRVHKSVLEIFEKHGISFEKQGVNMGFNSTLIGVKDKDKDKDKDKVQFLEKEKTENSNFEIPSESDCQNAFRSVMVSNGMDPEQMGGFMVLGSGFFAHYESQGWKKGNGMMIHKWKPLVSEWIGRERGRQTLNKTEQTKHTRTWE